MSRELADAIHLVFTSEYINAPGNATWKGISQGKKPAPGPVFIQNLTMATVLPKLAQKAKEVAGSDDKAAIEAAIVAAVEAFAADTHLSIVESFGKKQVVYTPPPPPSGSLSGAAESKAAQQQVGSKSNIQQQPQQARNNGANSDAAVENDDDNDDDVDSRSIFATPVHYRANEQQISDFFSSYGRVIAVERRKFVERGLEKLRPSVFVTFQTRDMAMACVAAKPTYGTCTSQLGGMFVPRLSVSMKGDPLCRDAIADEAAKAAGALSSTALAGGAAAAASSAADDNNKGDPFHRILNQRGFCLAARGIPTTVPQNEVHSRLGALNGARDAIDICFMPATTELLRVCYVYCKSEQATKDLLMAYKRVFNNNEPYKVSLERSVPELERLQGAEEEVAMKLYSVAVEARTKAKMEKNAKRRQRGE